MDGRSPVTDDVRHDGETPLVGNVTAGVVRIGDTVRRPAGPWTDSVDAVLRHLYAIGFTGAPRPLGRDEHGRPAYAAQAMGGLNATRPVDESARRLRTFVDAYGLDAYGLDTAGRRELAPMLGHRARAMYDMLRDAASVGREPWARINRTDGPYWLETADYLDTNVDAWRAALR